MGRPTHALIDNKRNKLAKIGASTKMTHTSFPKGTKFGYVVEIMTDREYRKKFTSLDAAWTLKNLTNPPTHNPSIKILNVELTK